jgi:hypothetical protein
MRFSWPPPDGFDVCAAAVLTNLGAYQDSKHLHIHVHSGPLAHG